MSKRTIIKIIVIAFLSLFIMVGSVMFVSSRQANPQFAPEILWELYGKPIETYKNMHATPSAEIATPSATPRSVPKQPKSSPTVAPAPIPGDVDCDLTQYGGGRSIGSEAECKDKIRQLISAGQPIGKHCSETPQGCGSQSGGSMQPLHINFPVSGGSVDLSYDSPDYNQAVEDFNNSVHMDPIELPCVPVGDGFNCL